MESAERNQRSLLQWENLKPDVYEALDRTKRTGWVRRGIENPESVKEHTVSLISLAIELSKQLSEDETEKLLEMLEIHDWPEAIHGDEVIVETETDDKQALKAAKFENEKRALETICSDLPNGQEIIDLWLRFETGDDPCAAFARQLDKYQAVEKALEYEEAQQIPLFEEFLTSSIRYITHPVLLARIETLKLRWAQQ